jgi:chromosome segregation ATPase
MADDEPGRIEALEDEVRALRVRVEVAAGGHSVPIADLDRLRRGLAAIGSHLSSAAEATDIRLASLEAQVEEGPLSDQLAALSDSVDQRLDGLTSLVAGQERDREVVQALTGRLDNLEEAEQRLTERWDDVDRRLAALVELQVTTAGDLERLAEAVAAQGRRLDALAESLRDAISALAEQRAAAAAAVQSPEPDTLLDDLDAQLAAAADRLARRNRARWAETMRSPGAGSVAQDHPRAGRGVGRFVDEDETARGAVPPVAVMHQGRGDP